MGLMKGVVECYNEKNELLFTRENMIVKGGRRRLLQSIFGNQPDVLTKSNFYASVGTNSELTTPDMEYDNVSESLTTGTTTEIKEINIDTENLYVGLEIEKLANPEGNETISSLYLYISEEKTNDETEEDETETTLFSRVVFPGYSNKDTLKFIYKIYF